MPNKKIDQISTFIRANVKLYILIHIILCVNEWKYDSFENFFFTQTTNRKAKAVFHFVFFFYLLPLICLFFEKSHS